MEDISSMHGLNMTRSPLSPPPTARPQHRTGNGTITPPEAPLKRSLSIPRKRLSLSFPVLPAGSNLSPRGAPPSPVYSPKYQQDADKPLTPDDPMAFLTALASQERRVLELKEELGKAEMELSRLKRQWAIHEATMKLHEITPTERLRPLNTSIAAAEGGIHSPAREQCQAKLSPATGRKVSSQRHTRTLSLLAGSRDDAPPALVKRHTVAYTPVSSPLSDADREKRNSQDVLLRTGKQMAEDFKEGLWTFIEDLRQATVGDEAISSTVNSTGIRASPNGTRSTSPRISARSGSPANSLKRERRKEESLIDFGDDNKSATNRIEEENLLLDGLSSASSSSMRWSTSTINSDSLGSSSRSSTPRTSTSSTTSNAIWNQAVVATTLKKATALVDKVEKTLAPLPVTGAGSTGYYEGKQGELRARSKTVGKKST